MFPSYRYMDSYPFQQGSNHMPSHQYYQPNSEPLPPQMMPDPSKFQNMNGFWPHGGNYGYPGPYQPCCGHNFPGYCSFRPACYYPPFPYPYCGNYPPFPQPQGFPVQYSPPPYYTTEIPRYEYDKNVPNEYHCCGCPHHKSSQKQEKGVTIEEQEQEQDAGQKDNGALVPVQLKNYPYPVVLIPQKYIDDRRFRPEMGNQDEDFLKRRSLEKSFQGKPRSHKKWSPSDINRLKSLRQVGDQNDSQNQEENEEGEKHFPFPVIWNWMPSPQKQEVTEETGRDTNEPKYPLVLPPGFKFISPKEPTGNLGTEPSTELEGINKLTPHKEEEQILDGSEATKKTPSPRSIQVKHVEPDKDNANVTDGKYGEKQHDTQSVNSEGRGRDVAVKQSDDHQKLKSSDAAKRQSTSPPKSKFSPVCLRVDPLPKKKNGNGSSQSPSPPNHKENLSGTPKASSSADKKGTVEQKLESSGSSPCPIKETKPEKEKRTIKVMDGTSKQDKGNKDFADEPVTQLPVKSPVDAQDPKKVGETDDKCKTRENIRETGKEGMKEVSEPVNSSGEKSVRKRFSDEEAATLIQSAYRGFAVRRWEPLKKLEQIAKVREQLEEVRKKVHDLESSSEIQKDDKQRAVLGEEIMSLLLKLDTIQGLHPSLRDNRKSLAKELTILQEKLDSIIIKLEKSAEREPLPKPVANDTAGTCENSCSEKREEKAEGPVVILSDASDGGTSMSREQQEGENPLTNEPKQGVEFSVGQAEAVEERDVVTSKEGDGQEILPEGQKQVDDSSESRRMPSIEDIGTNSVTESSELQNEAVNTAPTKAKEIERADSLVPDSSLLQELPVGVFEEESTNDNLEKGIQSDMKEEDMSLMDTLHELPVGAVEDEPVHSDLSKDGQSETREANMSVMDMLHELPVGAVEDEPVDQDLSKDDRPGMKEADAPQACEDTSLMDTMHELPIGALEDEPAIDDQAGMREAEAPNAEVKPADADLLHELPCGVADDESLSFDHENHKKLETADGVEIKPEQTQKLDKRDEVQQVIPISEENEINKPVNSEVAAGKEENVDETNKEEMVGRAEPEQPHITGEENNTTLNIKDNKLVEENEKMKEIIEKLLESGKNQLNVINDLTGRVKDLEKKLAAKKQKAKRRRFKTAGARSSCARPRNSCGSTNPAVNVSV